MMIHAQGPRITHQDARRRGHGERAPRGRLRDQVQLAGAFVVHDLVDARPIKGEFEVSPANQQSDIQVQVQLAGAFVVRDLGTRSARNDIQLRNAKGVNTQKISGMTWKLSLLQGQKSQAKF